MQRPAPTASRSHTVLSMAGSVIASLTAFVAGQPRLHRLANFAARRMAGRAFVGTSAVVVDGDDVLVARRRFRGDSWGLPGGWINRREEPSVACEREVFEETGIEVDAVAILATDVHAHQGQPVRYFGLTLAFYCVPRGPVDRTRPPPSAEVSELRWVPRSSCEAFVDDFSLTAIDIAFSRRRGSSRR